VPDVFAERSGRRISRVRVFLLRKKKKLCARVSTEPSTDRTRIPRAREEIAKRRSFVFFLHVQRARDETPRQEAATVT